MSGGTDTWNDDTIARLRALWTEGHSTAEIGRRMGVSKNAIVGKAHRLDLPARPSPIRRGYAPAKPIVARVHGPTLPKLASVSAPRPAPHVVRTERVPQMVQREPQAAPPPQPAPVIRPFAPISACCWPLGEPGTKGFRFCGDASAPSRPYCHHHCRRAYVRVRDRREDEAA